MKNKELQGRRYRKVFRKHRIIILAIPIVIFAALIIVLSKVNAINSESISPDESFEADSTETYTEESANTLSDSKVDDWNLILVNPWNYLPDDFEVSLTQLINGHAVDERCYPDLQDMMDDCRAEGVSPLICSSYRTQEKQEQLFNNKVDTLISQGYTETIARDEAATVIALPGTSEHHTGLALDIVDESNQNLDSSQEDTATQQWLIQNSWKYGFILRYPENKTDITGIQYEPWHYRYVGKEAAKEIFEQGICLEEYLEQLVMG